MFTRLTAIYWLFVSLLLVCSPGFAGSMEDLWDSMTVDRTLKKCGINPDDVGRHGNWFLPENHPSTSNLIRNIRHINPSSRALRGGLYIDFQNESQLFISGLRFAAHTNNNSCAATPYTKFNCYGSSVPGKYATNFICDPFPPTNNGHPPNLCLISIKPFFNDKSELLKFLEDQGVCEK